MRLAKRNPIALSVATGMTVSFVAVFWVRQIEREDRILKRRQATRTPRVGDAAVADGRTIEQPRGGRSYRIRKALLTSQRRQKW